MGAFSRTACATVETSSTTLGNISVTDLITLETPLFIFSLAFLLPATKSEKPSIISVIAGKSEPTILFFRPVTVPLTFVKLSSKLALAFTALSSITIP